MKEKFEKSANVKSNDKFRKYNFWGQINARYTDRFLTKSAEIPQKLHWPFFSSEREWVLLALPTICIANISGCSNWYDLQNIFYVKATFHRNFIWNFYVLFFKNVPVYYQWYDLRNNFREKHFFSECFLISSFCF